MPDCRARVLRTAGDTTAPVLEAVAAPKLSSALAEVHPNDLLRPGEEVIVGATLPAGSATYRLELSEGPARGAAVGLRFFSAEQRLVLDGDAQPHAAPPPRPPLDTVASGRTAGGLTPTPTASSAAPAASAPPPESVRASPPPSPAAVQLGLSVGASVDLAGTWPAGPVVGLSAALPLGWVHLVARVDALSVEHAATVLMGSAEPAELALRHDLVPLGLGLRAGYAWGRVRPEAELGLGAAWVNERLVALHGAQRRQERLLLVSWTARGGVSVRLGPGALRADALLRAHPAALLGSSAATGPLKHMVELHLGYVLGLGGSAQARRD